MQAENRTVQVNLRLAPSLKDAAERAAERDHRSLTSLIEKLLSEHIDNAPSLDDWHARAQVRFGDLLEKHKVARPLGALARSYAIKCAEHTEISPIQLLAILQKVHSELKHLSSSHHIAYPYTRQEMRPYFTSDKALERGADIEILECFAGPPLISETDFWRASPSGYLTDVRTIFEDHADVRQVGMEPGQFLSPVLLSYRLQEVVLHAVLLAMKFSTAQTIEFRCEWTGLKGRGLRDLRPGIPWPVDNSSRVDGRVTGGEWSISELKKDWAIAASALGAPILRLFDPTFDYSSNWIHRELQS